MPEAQPHLYLVDGSSYIFRAYHRLPPLTNRAGQPAGAVYGYCAMLWKLAQDLKGKPEEPTHLAVIFDGASGKTHRDAMFADYKANRPEPPDDLKPQFGMVREATRAFSLPVIEDDKLEADDIIACYAKAALAEGWRVTVVSSDKDLMQLIEDGRLDLLDTMNDRRIDSAYVVEKFGVPPTQLGEVLALMGDTSDNIPGVPSVGPKTAAQLIQQYGTVEGVLSHLDEIAKPKLRETLREHADSARLSRQLVELVCEQDPPRPLPELQMRGIPAEPLKAYLEAQGFNTLLQRMGGGMAAKPEEGDGRAKERKFGDVTIERTGYETIADAGALDRWITVIHAAGQVAIAVELSSLDAAAADVVGIALCVAEGLAGYIPVGHSVDGLLEEHPAQMALGDALERLRPVLESPSILKIAHDAKPDWVALKRHGIDMAPIDDTQLMSFALDAGSHAHDLDALAKAHFDHPCLSFKTICGTGQKQIPFARVPLPLATEYAAEDADLALRLHDRFKPRMAAERTTRVYELVDRPLVPVVGAMELEGVKVDPERLRALSSVFGVDIQRLEAEIYEQAGGPFTIGSPQQLGEVLFGKLGLPGGRKGKSGAYSTDVNELERLAAENVPIARMVVDWRHLTRLQQLYADALVEQINPATGRVHTRYSLANAQTGRLSATEPNLQTIPVRTEVGRQIREAFIAEPGNVILSADYSQIELRLAAHMADVPALKAAFANGDDIHSLTAQELFGSVDRDKRNAAKTINFAILYGISAFGLSTRTGMPRDEAQRLIDRYFERFPGIRNYIAETLTFVRQHGFTTTLFGRKTHFPRINSRQMNERQGQERAAINAPIQGSSADIIKRAMARMVPALRAAGLGEVRMLLSVHDELLFECPEALVERAAATIRPVMEGAAEPLVKLSVPLGVEIGHGPTWGSAH